MDIRDIYDSHSADGSADWQQTLYATLRDKLGLTNLPGEAKAFGPLLDKHDKDPSAIAFLAVYGQLIESGLSRSSESYPKLMQHFGWAVIPKHTELITAVLKWAQGKHEIRAWRVHRTVEALARLQEDGGRIDEAAIAAHWPNRAAGDLEAYPKGFPNANVKELVEAFKDGRHVPLPPQPDVAAKPIKFPEIWQDPKIGQTADDRQRIRDDNDKRQKLYSALRFLLGRDFGLAQDLPSQAQEFADKVQVKDDGSFTLAGAGAFLSVLGNLLAINLDDPLCGRPDGTSWSDDIIAKDDAGNGYRIAKRFADGVVAAMRDFTSRADLFRETQKLLAMQGRRAAPPALVR